MASDDSADEVEQFHKKKLLGDAAESSGDELDDDKARQKMTHEMVQYYMDEERRERTERMMEDDDESDEDEAPELGSYGNKKKDLYNTNKTGGLTSAERERMEADTLKEALLKQKTIETLMDNDSFLDPELEAMDSDESTEKETAKATETVSAIDQTHAEYIKIYNQLLETDLPKTKQQLKSLASRLPDILVEFLDLKRSIILDYMLSLVMYLNLRLDTKENLQFHPVSSRIQEYSEIFSSFTEEGEDLCLLNTMLEEFAAASDELDESPSEPKPSKNAQTTQNTDEDYEYYLQQLRKKREKAEKLKSAATKELASSQLQEDPDEGKRKITREMEKSKGHMLSKKKKMDRNPRVKLREKFRKKKIARKGQVREVRKPTRRYDGEYSGIRTGVTTSRKIH